DRNDGCQREEEQRSQGNLDRARIQVKVPPAAVRPFAAKIRSHPALEVDLLRVDPLDVVLRKRDWRLGKPSIGKAVSRRKGFRIAVIAGHDVALKPVIAQTL